MNILYGMWARQKQESTACTSILNEHLMPTEDESIEDACEENNCTQVHPNGVNLHHMECK